MSDINIKRKRKRPRTTQLRQDLRKSLETAILAPKSSILHLFSISETQYTANLFEVIKNTELGNAEKYLHLSTFGYKSLNNKTRIFTICGELSSKPEDLEISFQRKLRTRVFDTIAFVDNLPLLCTKERLWRRAALFGTVVDVHLPKPRKVFQKQGMLKGSIKVEHAGYGFVQFTSPYSVKRFCRRYAGNSHLRRHQKRGRKMRKTRLSRTFLNTSKNSQEENAKNHHESNFEWSESGLESEVELAPRRKRILTFNINIREIPPANTVVQESGTSGKKLKKIRRKRSLKSGSVSLRRLFRMIQVFPLRAYKKLKKEYYRLKRQTRQVYSVELAQQKEEESD
ncbi:hypothetical protein FO519_006400 [Halicephalobus sp. NKZ332]|nr:hypothetical protein FO519_006400 [Halicephalobus sp. NKZ332]